LVDKGEIKVDKDGNITDKNGKKVEVKDGKVEVKTDDGKTVTVKVNDVKTTVSNKNNNDKKPAKPSNSSSNNQKPAKPSNSSSNNQKPAKPSNSSSNNQKPAKPSESSKTETPTEKQKQKVWVVDYKTVRHEGYWKVSGSHEEPVYGWVSYDVCNDCGKKLADTNQLKTHLLWEARENGGTGSYHTEEEYVQTGTKTVEDKEWVKPWDEKVEDGGHWEYR
jgi:DNA mismatch repair ATPase MutL